MRARREQCVVFTYHRSGTVLFERVMTKLQAVFGLVVGIRYGVITDWDRRHDVLIVAHSLIGTDPPHPVRGVRIVRDPRDLWVSSYLYHRHCDEGWCLNTEFDINEPIGFPTVPYSVVHRTDAWKRNWVDRLRGKSYQENLLDRDEAAGLAFELDGYTGATLDAMRAWHPRPEVLDIKLEALATDYDRQMATILGHFGFDTAQVAQALTVAAVEDTGRMDDATLAADPHIHSRRRSKWPEMLSAAQLTGFETRHGNLIEALGYKLSRVPSEAFDRDHRASFV